MHLISSGDWPGDSTFSPENGFEMIMENNGIEWLIATGLKGYSLRRVSLLALEIDTWETSEEKTKDKKIHKMRSSSPLEIDRGEERQALRSNWDFTITREYPGKWEGKANQLKPKRQN